MEKENNLRNIQLLLLRSMSKIKFEYLFFLFCKFRFCNNNSDRPVKKCSFNIESLLSKDNQIANRSYNEDTEDGSSDDGHTSFRSPPISSYALFNQLKTLDMATKKSDLTRKFY
jgi:hypothetical protein